MSAARHVHIEDSVRKRNRRKDLTRLRAIDASREDDVPRDAIVISNLSPSKSQQALVCPWTSCQMVSWHAIYAIDCRHDASSDLFALVTQSASAALMLDGVVSRLKTEGLSLEKNLPTFDFYVQQVVTAPFAQENHVDVAMWLLSAATNPPDPSDNASIAIVLSLLETFIVGDSSSLCSELVARGFLPKLKEDVMGKHGKWASRPAIRLMYDICRLNRVSREGLGFADKAFLVYLFELIESTRYLSEELEDYNYSAIRLLVGMRRDETF